MSSGFFNQLAHKLQCRRSFPSRGFMSACADKLEIDLPILDIRRLHMIAESEVEKSSYLEIFFAGAESVLDDAEKAANLGSLQQWKEVFHTLRGAAANIGMATLEKICLEAERIGDSSPATLQAFLQKAKEELAYVRRHIVSTYPRLLPP